MVDKLSYRTKTDLVADSIKAMINSGELGVGTQLHQRDVADRLGVSPTPVREALRRLEAEGFVSIESHHPAVVVRPDNTELYENAVILGRLEGLGAEMAARKVTLGDIEALVDINRRLAEAATTLERISIDREFHSKVCDISASPVLLSQLNLLWRTIGSGPPLEPLIDGWVSEHQMIIDALVAGDCSEARDATNSHVLDGFKGCAPSGS